MLRKHRDVIVYNINVQGINPSVCMHRNFLNEGHKQFRQPQRRLNPTIQEVMKKEVLKLLVVGIVYPILDSAWPSLIQVVPKKGGVIVIKNVHEELIYTRTVISWHM